SSDLYHRLMANGKVDRVRDEADLVRPLVQRLSLRAVGAGRDGDARLQERVGEAYPTILHRHRRFRLVHVGGDEDALARGEREIAQHVAARKRDEEKILRIVLRLVALV